MFNNSTSINVQKNNNINNQYKKNKKHYIRGFPGFTARSGKTTTLTTVNKIQEVFSPKKIPRQNSLLSYLHCIVQGFSEIGWYAPGTLHFRGKREKKQPFIICFLLVVKRH